MVANAEQAEGVLFGEGVPPKRSPRARPWSS